MRATLKVCTGLLAAICSLSALHAQTAAGPHIGDCPIFPQDNVWNTRIDGLQYT